MLEALGWGLAGGSTLVIGALIGCFLRLPRWLTAAVMAAVEQFLRDTAPPPADEPKASPWITAARREAVPCGSFSFSPCAPAD